MCGVIGLAHSRPQEKSREFSSEVYREAILDVLKGMMAIQHRGQDGAGLVSYDLSAKRFFSVKGQGPVNQALSKNEVERLSGEFAIGHNRYPTAGSFQAEDLQPLMSGFPIGIGMAHNGNLVNHQKIASDLATEHSVQFLTQNDLESFLHTFSLSWAQENSKEVVEKLRNFSRAIAEKFVGGFSLVGLIAGEGLFGMRDPHGIRPLVIGRKKEEGLTHYILSSETSVLQLLGYELYRDLKPGELVFIGQEKGLMNHPIFFQYAEKKRKVCMFEWVYFSAAESFLESRSVYEVRLRLGRELGEQISLELKNQNRSIADSFDVVCPVPDTSRTAAIALAETLNLPYREGLIKNRYIQRSFILSDQKSREKTLSLKLAPVRSEIEGKRVLLVDDSLVRGSTSLKIIELLKAHGAKEVTLALTCPAIKHPCFYGIDFPEPEELAANKRGPKEVSDWIGAREIFYIEQERLEGAIGLTGELCTACVSGDYPTKTDDFLQFTESRRNNRQVKS